MYNNCTVMVVLFVTRNVVGSGSGSTDHRFPFLPCLLSFVVFLVLYRIL